MSAGLLSLAAIALGLFCVFDVSLSDAASVRSRSKPVWLAIVLVPVVGPFAWFSAGRPELAGAVPGSLGPPRGEPVTVFGPEDDPAFIRELAERLRRDDSP